jgi:hypothetical protein
MLIDVVSYVQDQTFVTNYIHWVLLVEPVPLLLQSANNDDLQFTEIAAACARAERLLLTSLTIHFCSHARVL